MIPMTASEIAALVGGRLADADPAAVVRGAATLDSRAVEPDGLFVALRGEHVDGHDFARSAIEAGAALVLAARATGAPSVVVEDVSRALDTLAREVVARVEGVRVLALTGSQGKTSTKDLLAQVLAAEGPTVATAGNFNNELGVPLTLLRTTADTRFLVVEMGARGVGHIAHLCSVARPDVAAVLNVGTAHLGEFGSRADIARAKGEIVEGLPSDGTAVLNADDDLVAPMAARTAARVRRFGLAGERSAADVRADDVLVDELTLDELGRPRFVLVEGAARHAVELRTLGRHQAVNAAAAAALARAVDVPLDRIAAALSAASRASAWRMELHEVGGVVVLNDAYNANPESMRAALRTLGDIGAGGAAPRRTIAVLGVMRELGEDSEAAHEEIGAHVVALGVDRLVVVGEEAAGIARGALAAGGATEVVVLDSRDAAQEWVRRHVRAPDVVLVKASRGAALEHVADALLRALTPSTADQSIDQEAPR